MAAQPLQGTRNAHPGGVLGHAEAYPDFGQAAALEEAQQDGLAVRRAQARHSIIEERLDRLPDRIAVAGGAGLPRLRVQHSRHFPLRDLLFVSQAALFPSDGVAGGKPRCLEQPTGQAVPAAQPGCLFRQDKENGLRDIFGEFRVADFPPTGGVDQAQVPMNESGKGGLRLVFHIPAQ